MCVCVCTRVARHEQASVGVGVARHEQAGCVGEGSVALDELLICALENEVR